MIPAQIVKQYESHCKETSFLAMSRSTMYRILNVCSASVRKSLQGLDNVSSEGAKAFDDLYDVVSTLGDECGKGLTWSKEQTEMLKKAKRYLKTDYKVHISDSSTVADHCRVYALSDPHDSDYMYKCNHDHKDRCDRCEILPTVINEVRQGLDSLAEGSEKDKLSYQFEQGLQKIEAWKAHILRSINQDQARLDIIQNLSPESVLIVLDWAMKWLPRKFRETQSDWFGKRGISWHISVALRKGESGNLEFLTFVHLFENCSQDSSSVLAIINDVFLQLKKITPKVTSIFLRQDNAGCYHSAEVFLSINKIAEKHDVKVSMDFSDPQGGKGSCDRKAASLKSKMKIYLNEGHDIETAEQMVEAIESRDGVPGVRVRLCGRQTDETDFSLKWEGISILNNIKFSKEGIRVWRAYGIGQGKMKPWKEFKLPETFQVPTLTLPTEMSHLSASAKFTDVLSKLKPTKASVPPKSTESSSATSEDSVPYNLFFCPEDCCIKSFQRESSLQRHLDCGKHQYALERETFYDKAMILYASKLEQGSTSELPQLSLPRDQDTDNNQKHAVELQMGWALKKTRSHKRLTEKQKGYLLEFYEIGEQTGHKADPVMVSRAMKNAKVSSGNPKFTVAEYLSAQQISGFFSRETARRRKASTRDRQEAATEHLIQEMQREVLSTLSIRHPITYECYNLCEYSAVNKLDKLSVSTLHNICTFFDLDTSSLKGGRRIKKPYIRIVTQFVNKCSCSSA